MHTTSFTLTEGFLKQNTKTTLLNRWKFYCWALLSRWCIGDLIQVIHYTGDSQLNDFLQDTRQEEKQADILKDGAWEGKERQ